MTGGPLQYQYQAEQLVLHWGRGEGVTGGSEHSVNQQSWPAELQLYGYNSQLYNNLTQAQEEPGGVVGVAVMLQVKGDIPDPDNPATGLTRLVSRLSQVKYRGDTARIHQMSLASLLPNTGDYVTYEGSTTYPGCWETVTWIMMNKPVYISRQEMELFHQLSQGADSSEGEQPGLGNTLRPRQNLNRRIVRTNIDLKYQGDCSVDTSSERQFQANTWLHRVAQDRLAGARGEFILK